MTMQAMELQVILFTLLSGAVGVLTAAHALLYKRHPQSAFAWIAVSLTLPLVGATLYYLFGINRVRTRAQRLRAGQEQWQTPETKPVKPPAALEELVALGTAVSGMTLTTGNRVDILHNGDQAYPAMLEAIRKASEHIYLSSYIFDSSPVGQEFVTALADAVSRGVDVRVLLDGVGELYSFPRARSLLRKHNVRHAHFLPPRIWPPMVRINLRNHRKILAIDGSIAFTGGMNIARRHMPSESNDAFVVDIHFRLQGPIASQIECIFLDDWRFITGEDIPMAQVRPPAAGDAICRAIAHGPDEEMDRLTALLSGAIAEARRRIAIMTPYFLPPRELIGVLQAAALGGLDVAVVLPSHNNLPYVHRATRHMLWELLQRGVKVYYQPPPFVHSKLLLVDDQYALIGSANIDTRSLRLNFKLNVEIYDSRVVDDLSRHFEAA
ncbi:MAG TPA: phospholipase D-like domain-containing protein, partial [Gammaproteobacteria bacterium]